MKILLVCALVICGVLSENPHKDLTEVIAQVIADTDVNPTDGIISAAEFEQELLAKWSSDGGASVSEQDFVHQWTTRYGDNHKDATAFFNNLDKFFPFRVLTEADLLFHLGTLDPDGDQQVAVEDFKNFIRVNHPCGQHGHLYC